jgi:hypothetical protein
MPDNALNHGDSKPLVESVVNASTGITMSSFWDLPGEG